MIQYIDGFDASDTIYKYEFVPNFLQDRIIDGKVPYWIKNGGNAYRVESTAFSSFVLTKTFDSVGGSNPGWIIGFDFKVTGSLSDFLLRFENGPLAYPGHAATQPLLNNVFTQAGVQIESDGRLSFWTGAGMDGTNSHPGTRLGYTSASLPSGYSSPWVYVEIAATFGSGGSMVCRFDGTTVYDSGPTTIGNPTYPGAVNAVTLYFPPSFSVDRWFDNLYIADNQIDPWGNPQDFLGPCQVTSHWPIEDATTPEWTRNGGSSDYSRVADINHSTGYMGSPDKDTSYIDGQSNQMDMFTIKKTDCFGKVLALALNAYGRDKVAGSNSTIQFLARSGRSNVTVDNQQSWIVSYAPNPWYVVQAISQASLVNSGDVWNDGQINNCAWGLQAPGTAARVSQFYLEKLVSLTETRYSCSGLSSYSY